MADGTPPQPEAPEVADAPETATPGPTPKKSSTRRRTGAPAETTAGAKAPSREKARRAPRRPTLTAETTRLLRQRDQQDDRRPKFTRQASYRYWRIGRWENWRRPRGQQSKQRRHYGYRSTVVSIGFGSPRKIRGLTPSGFRPILVRTSDDLTRLNAATDAAVIARTVGTRRRLVLEETARKLGVHVLNPLVQEREETEA
ncbi:MAG: 50S ribosomal protein L32e [Thermoplasmata archaeon]